MGMCFGNASAEDHAVNFVRDIKPVLARRCFACHGPNKHEGGLRLDKPDAALAPLDSGLHAIVPGKADESALLARVSSTDEADRMPPEGNPLTAKEIDALRQWIAAGAKWEKHWAFVPPTRHDPPEVKNRSWVENPIDSFILAGLDNAKMEPAPDADRRTLARRAYFGVTGLPPTNTQLQSFLADDAPDAWPQLVDKLLASPHFGEQWARHWLDLVRFAETNSFERDGLKANAWRYRDYVIRSFNEDKPYDQFIREQLAGDELDQVTDESMIATGYYRLGTWDDEPADPLQARYDDFDDILSTTSQVMLGLTVGCARCHDHKIDPIPQADYYGLLAFFADVTPYADPGDRDPDRFSQWSMSKPEERQQRDTVRDKVNQIRGEVGALEAAGIRRMPERDQDNANAEARHQLIEEKLDQFLTETERKQYKDAKERLTDADAEFRKLPVPKSALALAHCEPHPKPMHIMLRGNPHVPGDVVEPHYPALFGDAPPKIPVAGKDAKTAGRRRILAEWITSPQNMLTARVIVNRVWQHYFGRGLVRTTNNFGELGTPPTHPELLDYLALWLVDHDWQLKPLHRLILTSHAYRMSSATNPQALAVDPTNDLLWRFDMRRLSAEEIHDAALVVSGALNKSMFGHGYYPKMSQEVLATQSRPGAGWHNSSVRERSRRSVYMHVKRSLLPPLLTAFDFPDVDATCEARFITTQPGQALAMLHGDFLNDQAEELAKRVKKAAGDDAKAQVAKSIQFALDRPATENEISEGLALIDRLKTTHNQNATEALRYWCLTVLNLNEFVYLD